MIVEDLDALRPEPHFIKLGGKEIDITFLPCAITFDIDAIVRQIGEMDKEELLENGSATKEAFDLTIKMCVIFCQHSHPEMDEEWFRNNTDAFQLQAFSSAIKEALVRAYVGINPKNG